MGCGGSKEQSKNKQQKDEKSAKQDANKNKDNNNQKDAAKSPEKSAPAEEKKADHGEEAAAHSEKADDAMEGEEEHQAKDAASEPTHKEDADDGDVDVDTHGANDTLPPSPDQPQRVASEKANHEEKEEEGHTGAADAEDEKDAQETHDDAHGDDNEEDEDEAAAAAGASGTAPPSPERPQPLDGKEEEGTAAPQGSTVPPLDMYRAGNNGGGSNRALQRKSVGGDTHSIPKDDLAFEGPGIAADCPYTDVYRCFNEGNGLLFRVIHARRHTWAFYNDTEVYTMKVTVTFGHESSVKPLGNTTQEVLDEETGHCRLELTIGPGETQMFMRGEYNGCSTSYDAEPVEGK